MCTINEDHLIYGFWDIKHNGQSFLSFWTNFCHSTLLTNQKIKILKKWKKHLEILSFYTCVSQITFIWCMVPKIWSTTGTIFSHSGNFTPRITQIINILKKWKNTWRYHHFTKVYQTSWSYAILFLRYGSQQM